jgi:hypothetical protein
MLVKVAFQGQNDYKGNLTESEGISKFILLKMLCFTSFQITEVLK